MAEITDDIRALLLDPDFPDAEIAELASVPVEEVARLRVWAGLADTVKAPEDAAATAPKAIEDEAAAPEPTPEPAKPAKGKAKPAPAPAPKVPKAAPAEEKAPDAVRVTTRGGSTVAPSGVIGIRIGIIYRGPDAAYLWKHHRDKVEPYPTKG